MGSSRDSAPDPKCASGLARPPWPSRIPVPPCLRHHSPWTEQTYRHWVKRFIFFHNVRHPAEMAEPEIKASLWYKNSWATVTSRPQ